MTNNLNNYINWCYLLKAPLITDKTTLLLEQNKYVFLVDRKVKKPLLKTLIEDFFDVKVSSINTILLPRKKRVVGKFSGYNSRYKKIIVKLEAPYKIDYFSNT